MENNFIYMVLEYAKNGNLYSHIFKKKKIEEKEALKYFKQAAEAVHYLHSQHIFHRDIKPENILLDSNFNFKLCDFGWCSEEFVGQRKTFCGTFEYMAPEILFKKPYDYRIDIWSLGVLLFELTHGSAPF